MNFLFTVLIHASYYLGFPLRGWLCGMPHPPGGDRTPCTGKGRSTVLIAGVLCVVVYVAIIHPYSVPSLGSVVARPQYEALRQAGGSAGGGGRGVYTDCLNTDTLLLTPTAPAHHAENDSVAGPTRRTPRPIPLLATNLDYDTEGFLGRLLDGWANASARHKLVVAGGCDPSMLKAVEYVRSQYPDVAVFREREALGCAPGWNRALDYMLYHEDVEWCLLFNTDVYVPPGALDTLAKEVWAEYDQDPQFCRGFFNVTAGPDAVVFAFTRHGLQALGRFDENIYPAYYEDQEMDLRHNRSLECTSPPRRFVAATLHHGRLGSAEYKSGTSVLRDHWRQEGKRQPRDSQLRKWERDLSNRLDRGFVSSRLYVSAKWGCDAEQERCLFAHPFNNPQHPLSYWRLDWARRECILRQERRVRACRYMLEEPAGSPFPYPEALVEDRGGRRTGLRGFWR